MEGYQPGGVGAVPGPGATFPGPTILYFVNPWVTTDLIKGAAKKEQGNPTIYLYAFLNNTTGKTLSLVSGTIILTTANSGAEPESLLRGRRVYWLHLSDCACDRSLCSEYCDHRSANSRCCGRKERNIHCRVCADHLRSIRIQ